MLISTMTTKSSQIFLKSNSEIIFLFGSILTSLGILLVTVGGSWDITNHLLSKPETFFSPPHALMYSGVAISLVGVVLTFVGWKNLQKFKHNYWNRVTYWCWTFGFCLAFLFWFRWIAQSSSFYFDYWNVSV